MLHWMLCGATPVSPIDGVRLSLTTTLFLALPPMMACPLLVYSFASSEILLLIHHGIGSIEVGMVSCSADIYHLEAKYKPSPPGMALCCSQLLSRKIEQ